MFEDQAVALFTRGQFVLRPLPFRNVDQHAVKPAMPVAVGAPAPVEHPDTTAVFSDDAVSQIRRRIFAEPGLDLAKNRFAIIFVHHAEKTVLKPVFDFPPGKTRDAAKSIAHKVQREELIRAAAEHPARHIGQERLQFLRLLPFEPVFSALQRNFLHQAAEILFAVFPGAQGHAVRRPDVMAVFFNEPEFRVGAAFCSDFRLDPLPVDGGIVAKHAGGPVTEKRRYFIFPISEHAVKTPACIRDRKIRVVPAAKHPIVKILDDFFEVRFSTHKITHLAASLRQCDTFWRL